MEESLYLAEVKLLTRYCHNCLDNKMKERIMMFLFKKELYDNATKLGLTEDAESSETTTAEETVTTDL